MRIKEYDKSETVREYYTELWYEGEDTSCLFGEYIDDFFGDYGSGDPYTGKYLFEVFIDMNENGIPSSIVEPYVYDFQELEFQWTFD